MENRSQSANTMKRFFGISGFVLIVAVSLPGLSGCSDRTEMGPVADAANAKGIHEVLVATKAGGNDQAAAATGTGWATIKGQFVYDGDPPAMPPYNVTKE